MVPSFDPPGPGAWAIDRSHYPGGVTPVSQWLLEQGFLHGFSRVFEELGTPAEGIDIAFVNGFMYTRLRPLVGADNKPRKLPPVPVLKLVSRLHPTFRKRAASAAATLRDRPWLEVLKRWDNELKPDLIATNQRFQAFDVDAANDVELQSHISALLDQSRNNFVLHIWLHGHDLGPIARYLHAALGWGLNANEAIAALAGASPSTAKPMQTLCELRTLLEADPQPITNLAELRASSGRAGELIDAYLAERGLILATGYDLDSRTLGELPEAIMSSIRSAAPAPEHDAEAIADSLRSQLTSAETAHFDDYLGDARSVMDMRDDNGPLTIEWPVGLLRRALLAAGHRLHERGALNAAEHLFEVAPHEAHALFNGSLPLAEAMAGRAEQRIAHAQLDPPAMLGEPEPAPPLSVLPPALADLTEMIQVAMSYFGMDGDDSSEPMAGAGIGNGRYVGTARVSSSADDALDRLEPGDVLVVRATSPAFNVVLAIAGAVVTSDGGVLSHAAVLSRELGIPAVIGARGALDIVDGSTVEVDAQAGIVRVVNV